jgi:hypothetical protein
MEAVQQTTQQPKKRIIKIKKKAPEVTKPEESVEVKTEVLTNEKSETSPETSDEKDVISLIPSSRVKNYISKEKLNKEMDSLIEKIKSSTEPLDLNTLLSEDLQSKIGSIIKEKEEKKEEININSIAVDLLSKQKFKFSHTSFKVLSVFLDLMIEDLTLNVMDEIVKNKKSIINLKYVYTAETSSPLYSIYSKLPTYISEQSNLETNEEQTETTDDTSTEEESKETHSINFEFYVRKICNKLKKNKEEYSKIKVSNNYQKFCSNLILEFLDMVAPLTSILLEVMTTKTITNLVFETVLKLQLYNNPKQSEIMTELNSRLSN